MTSNMKFYRVKYGYGKDDFYSVDENELPKAIRAQVNGTIFVCEEGTIAGNNIMAISPDYNRALGLNRDYELKGEDYNELGTLAVREHRLFLQEAKNALQGGVENKRLKDG